MLRSMKNSFHKKSLFHDVAYTQKVEVRSTTMAEPLSNTRVGVGRRLFLPWFCRPFATFAVVLLDVTLFCRHRSTIQYVHLCPFELLLQILPTPFTLKKMKKPRLWFDQETEVMIYVHDVRGEFDNKIKLMWSHFSFHFINLSIINL
jgi:hypothetical protein